MILFHNIVVICLLTYYLLFAILWFFRKGVCFKLLSGEAIPGMSTVVIICLVTTPVNYLINGPEDLRHVAINFTFIGLLLVVAAVQVLGSIRSKIKGDF